MEIIKKNRLFVEMEDYNTELVLRIDWSEMDLFGHVNNVSFFKYVQASRVNYWELTGVANLHKEKNIGPMLASTNMQFKKPLYYPGKVTIKCKLNFVKTTSFSFHHVLLDDKGEIAAEADDVMVLYDFNKNEKMPLPGFVLEAFEKREKRKLQP